MDIDKTQHLALTHGRNRVKPLSPQTLHEPAPGFLQGPGRRAAPGCSDLIKIPRAAALLSTLQRITASSTTSNDGTGTCREQVCHAEDGRVPEPTSELPRAALRGRTCEEEDGGGTLPGSPSQPSSRGKAHPVHFVAGCCVLHRHRRLYTFLYNVILPG